MAERPNLYGRVLTLTLGSVKLSEEMRVVFEVDKNTKKEPNTSSIEVYNLAESTRKKLQEQSDIYVELSVGYPNLSDTIFVGTASHILSHRDGAEHVTRLDAGDGLRAIQTSRVSKAFRAVSVDQYVNELLDPLGLGPGNYQEWRRVQRLPQRVERCLVVHGQPATYLDQFARDHNSDFSVQNNKPTFTVNGKIIDTRPSVKLTPDSGLIGSPELTKKGALHVRALIQPGLEPGRGVEVQSAQAQGLFQVQSVKYRGDTRGADWYADIRMVKASRA